MYCVPGVTSERCRGTFWETGKLYEKGQEGGPFAPEEYTAALARIREIRVLLGELRKFADDGDVKQVGEVAAHVGGRARRACGRVEVNAALG